MSIIIERIISKINVARVARNLYGNSTQNNFHRNDHRIPFGIRPQRFSICTNVCIKRKHKAEAEMNPAKLSTARGWPWEVPGLECVYANICTRVCVCMCIHVLLSSATTCNTYLSNTYESAWTLSSDICINRTSCLSLLPSSRRFLSGKRPFPQDEFRFSRILFKMFMNRVRREGSDTASPGVRKHELGGKGNEARGRGMRSSREELSFVLKVYAAGPWDRRAEGSHILCRTGQ